MQTLDAAWRDLQPWLEQLEAERRDKLRRFWMSLPLGVGAAVIIGGASALFQAPGQVSAIMGVIVAALVISWGFAPLGSLKERLKIGLNQRLAEAFGLSYREKPSEPARFDSFRAHGLIPSYDRRSFEDHFSGKAHGADFELYEAKLMQRRQSKNRTYYVTVFHGALIRIRFPRTIEGVTLVTRDKGLFNALDGWAKKTFGRAGRQLERIGLVDPAFEDLFEVYGTDQVMARYLLTPSFMERLLELETLLKGKNVRCVFDESLADGHGEGELLIAAETGNLFEAGSIFAPADQRERVETLFKEIKLIDRTIETVLEPATER